MSKKNRQFGNTDAAVVDGGQAQEQEQVQPEQVAAVEAPVAGPNYTLTYRRDHPGNRCSYGIMGVAGIVVFDKGLFGDGVAPAVITMDCELAQPKLDAKQAKAELAAQKAAERAEKAAKKAAETAAKIAERATKAQAALDKAKAKVEAAAGTVTDGAAAAE